MLLKCFSHWGGCGDGVVGAMKPKLESRVVPFKSSPRLTPLAHLYGAALQARLTDNKI